MAESIFDSYINLYEDIPDFLQKYLETPSIKRLQNIGYFCGMDYASKDIYDFSMYISRYDHSLSVALLTWSYTHDKPATIAALYHDVATPCFSHVIDYLNKDYEKQESTEEFTKIIVENDQMLLDFLKEDKINPKDIYDFKKYSIVDNKRPRLCADRFDGLILTGVYWTKTVTKEDIYNLVSHLAIFINEKKELELGFTSYESSQLATKINSDIDEICHSNEDNYMMELLASITQRLLELNIISYNSLYILDEPTIFNIIENTKDSKLQQLYTEFKTKKREDIPETVINNIKKRTLSPLYKNYVK